MFVSDAVSVGVFTGPWETDHVAQDGAVIGFADIERSVKRALTHGGIGNARVVDLDIGLFVSDRLADELAGLDVLYANCGPLAALLLYVREQANLDVQIIREVRTLGWIGYAFQEYIAGAFQRTGDVCTHVSDYSLHVWKALRSGCRDVHYYPMLHDRPGFRTAERGRKGGLCCGYFSRLSRDKGFDYLPALIEKIRAVGWPIHSLDICGANDDDALVKAVCEKLEARNVAVRYHGELDHRQSLSLMASVDVVLFPSVSSFEGVGRVVIEACGLGKTVFASDYCGARDILAPAYRIPLSMPEPTSGPTAYPFPIAGLDIDSWDPPPPVNEEGNFDGCHRYQYNTEDFFKTFISSCGQDTGQDCPGHGLRMYFDWDQFDRMSKEAWCARVSDLLISVCRNKADILDLGGVMKRSIMRAGFVPDVTFCESS